MHSPKPCEPRSSCACAWIPYVFRDADRYYMVGPKLAKLGRGANYQASLCRASAEVLDKLRSETGETVNLA